MTRRFARALQALLAALVLTVGIGAVASPAMADTTCPTSGYLCAWTSTNFTGSKLATNAWDSCQNLSGSYDNNLTSIKVSGSPSSNDWELYSSYNCSGTFIVVSNGQWIANLATLGYDNTISSIRGTP